MAQISLFHQIGCLDPGASTVENDSHNEGLWKRGREGVGLTSRTSPRPPEGSGTEIRLLIYSDPRRHCSRLGPKGGSHQEEHRCRCTAVGTAIASGTSRTRHLTAGL